MDKKLFKSIVLLFLIASLFILAIIHFSGILSGMGLLLGILSPLTAGVLISLILERPFSLLKNFFLKILKNPKNRIRTASVLAMILTYLLFFAFITVFLIAVIPEVSTSISNLVTNLGSYAQNMEETINGIIASHSFLQNHFEPVDFSGWEGQVSVWLKQLLSILEEKLPEIFNITKSIASGVLNTIMSIMISVYVLYDQKHLIWQAKKTVYACLPEKAARKIHYVAKLSVDTFANYISGRIIDSVIIGILCFICMNIFGFEYATLISILVGVTNIIPVFGPFIGAIPSALLLLLVDPKECFWFIVFIIVLQQLDGNVIGPKIQGEFVGLPALWVVVAITLGGGLFGVLGMLLGVPVFAVLYTVAKSAVRSKAGDKGITLQDYPVKDPPKEKLHRVKDRLNALKEKRKKQKKDPK